MNDTSAIEKKKLGKTGLLVTHLSLGGLFVSSLGTDLAGARQVVQRALELGINYIDTAPGYLNSEEVLGICLEGVTQPYFLSTKLGGRPSPFNPKDKDQLRFSIQESLRLLKRDTIDILYIHEPDRGGQYDWYDSWDTFHGPVCEVLEELKAKGIIRFTGLGGTTVHQLTRIVEKGNYDVLLTAFNYSLIFREAAETLIPAAHAKGMGIVAGSPLQQGWLAARYDEIIRSDPPAWLAPQRARQLLRLYDFSDRAGISVPELALRFVLSHPQIDAVLTGSRSVSEIEANVQAAQAGPLPADVLAELDEIAAMLPCRPFEEPFGAIFANNRTYHGPGMAR
jgi:aryl-alcohol dehydrogenase-like predicted oxidoreductase